MKMPTSFLWPSGRRTAVAGRGATGLQDDVVSADARALELHVAADALTQVRDAVPIDERRHDRLGGVGSATDDGHQVGVVGAVDLVVVREGAGIATVVDGAVLVARLVEGGLAARRGLAVEAGHHNHAVVVARVGHGRLDLVVVAELEELTVDPQQLAGLLAAERPVVGRPDVVTAAPRLGDGPLHALERVLLAHDAGLSGLGLVEGRGQGADRGELATGAGRDGAVGLGVGPVRRPLHVGLRRGGHRDDTTEGDHQG